MKKLYAFLSIGLLICNFSWAAPIISSYQINSNPAHTSNTNENVCALTKPSIKVTFDATSCSGSYSVSLFKVGNPYVAVSIGTVVSNTSTPPTSTLTFPFLSNVSTHDNGVYAIIISATGCKDSIKFTLVVDSASASAGLAVAAVCQGGSTAALGGSFGGVATSAVWSSSGSGTFANNTGSTPSTATYTAAANDPATVTLTLTTAGGSCGTTSANKSQTVNPNPTVSAGSILADVCQGGTTAALGGSFGGSATSAVWSSSGSGTFANNTGSTPSTATYTAAANDPATVTLTLTTVGGSCGTTSANKSQTVKPLPNSGFTISNAAGPHSLNLCADSILTLTGPSATSSPNINSYSWSGGTPQNVQSTAINAAGTYTLTTTANGCTASSSQNITLKPHAPLSISTSTGTDSFCAGSSVTLTASGIIPANFSYQWSNSVAITTQSTTVSIPQSYVVTVTEISAERCGTIASRTIRQITPLDSTISTSSTQLSFCKDSFITLKGVPRVGATYAWASPPSTGVNNLINKAGTYNLTVSYIVPSSAPLTTCTARNSITIGNYPKPNALIKKFDSIQCFSGNTFSFRDSSTITSPDVISRYYWNFNLYNSTSIPNPAVSSGSQDIVSYSKAGTARVFFMVTSNHNCRDTAVVNVKINPTPVPTIDTVKSLIYCKDSLLKFRVIDGNTPSNNPYTSVLWNWGNNDSISKSNASDSAWKSYPINNEAVYSVIAKAYSGNCFAYSAPLTIAIHPNPVGDFMIDKLNQCLKGDTFRFTNNQTIPSPAVLSNYVWIADSIINNRISYQTNKNGRDWIVSFNKADSFNINLLTTSDKGCKLFTNKRVRVFSNPKVTITNTLKDSLCNKQGYALGIAPLGNFTYVWSGTNLPTRTTASITDTINKNDTSSAIVFQVIVNDVGSNGCPDTAYKTIYTYPLPNQPVIIQGTDSLCFGSTARFSIGNVQSNVKYLWGNDFNASGSRGANDSIYDVVMGTSSAQSVYVTATTTNYAHACSLKTPKPVTVKSYTSTSVVIDKLPSSINGQYILVCGSVDTSLTYQWGYSLGGTENLIANATSQSYIVDSSKAGANFYVIITDAQGCKSKEYYNKNNILSIADIMDLNTEVMVSPNPTTTAYHLRINSERVQNWNIQITDIAGRSVHNERLTGDKSNLWKIEASGWASGTYYLRVQSQSGDFATLTLIKE